MKVAGVMGEKVGWKQIKNRFKNLSLKKKLLTFYSILFVLPLLLISIMIYREVSVSMMEKIQYSTRQSYDQAKSYLEYKILRWIQQTDVIVTNSNLIEMIRESNAKKMNIHKQIAQKENIREYLQSVEGSNQSVRIKIYISDELMFYRDGDYICPLTEAEQSQWYQKKGNQKVYFTPGIYLEPSYQDKYVALVRDISDQRNYQMRHGVIRMDIGIENLEEILKNATPTENAVTYLINRENKIVATSDHEKFVSIGLSEESPGEFNYAKNIDDSGLKESKLKDKKVYYMQNKIRNTDWQMITIVPKADMVRGITKIQYNVILMMLLFGILTITGGAMIVSWIVRRISYLIDNINRVKEGHMDVYLENDSHDEIGMLYDNYNEMIERTNDLMEEKYRMGISLKNAELKALQSQINPHFLYNTLDLLNWLAYAGRTEDIHNAVVSLSKYYRLILNKGEDTLTLEEELQHVKYYMNIQDIRFPNKLTYKEHVEEGIKKSIVPKIILQPMVENAINHGIWNKKSKQGCIQILGYTENEKVACIKVIDNGIGMDLDTLAHIMDGNIITSGSSYGIKNVHARLQLMFGKEYGLSYESKEGEGTCVTIRFPKDIDIKIS